MRTRPLRVYLLRDSWRADFSLPVAGRNGRRRFRIRVPGANSEQEALAIGAVLRDRLARKLLAQATGKRGDLTYSEYLDQVYWPAKKRRLRPSRG